MFKVGPYQAPVDGDGVGAGAPPAAVEADGGAATPPVVDTPASSDTDVQWDEFIADDPVEEPTPATDDPPASASTPPAEPGQQPAAQQPPAQAPAVPPQAPAQAQPAPAQQPTAEQLAARDQQIQQARVAMRDELTGIYANELDDDTKAALLADPASVMPRLLAQAALDGANMAVQQMIPILPHVVQHTTAQQQGAVAAWGEFDRAAPDLAKPEYRRATVAAINTVKGSGVKYATKAEAVAAVARVTRAMLQIPEPGQAPAQGQQPSAAPVAPHTPVARGAARQPASKAKSTNPWLELIDD